jgi:hypothetical protein
VQAVAHEIERRFGKIAQIHPGQDPGAVRADGIRAPCQYRGDHRDSLAGEQGEEREFALGEHSARRPVVIGIGCASAINSCPMRHEEVSRISQWAWHDTGRTLT